jgi:hypothetical protein
MPCLPDNPDRSFSATPSNNKIDNSIDESLVVGYSELIDDSRVRFRLAEIINRAISQPSTRRW